LCGGDLRPHLPRRSQSRSSFRVQYRRIGDWRFGRIIFDSSWLPASPHPGHLLLSAIGMDAFSRQAKLTSTIASDALLLPRSPRSRLVAPAFAFRLQRFADLLEF